MGNLLQTIGLLAIAILCTVLITRWATNPQIVVERVYEQEKIDSLTVALQNTRLDRHRIAEELRETTISFQQRVRSANEQIASLTRLSGELSLQVDSLQDRVYAAPSVDFSDPVHPILRDTTLLTYTVAGDSLLLIRSSGGIESGRLFLDPPSIEQLRPVQLDLAIMIRESDRSVTSIASSSDFSELNLHAMSELQPPRRRFPWFWVGLGVGAGAILLLD